LRTYSRCADSECSHRCWRTIIELKVRKDIAQTISLSSTSFLSTTQQQQLEAASISIPAYDTPMTIVQRFVPTDGLRYTEREKQMMKEMGTWDETDEMNDSERAEVEVRQLQEDRQPSSPEVNLSTITTETDLITNPTTTSRKSMASTSPNQPASTKRKRGSKKTQSKKARDKPSEPKSGSFKTDLAMEKIKKRKL